MFVETITSPRSEWEAWNERLGMLTDPPETLVATIAWDAGEDYVTAVNVWDSAEAIGQFFESRVSPILHDLGEPTSKPARHGPPITVYLRPRV
jgi:hypothetical protein